MAGVVGQIISMSRAVGPLVRMFTRHLYAVVNSRQDWVYLTKRHVISWHFGRLISIR